MVTFDPGVRPPRSKIEKIHNAFNGRQRGVTNLHDRVCCEKQAAAWLVTASVVNYLYFAVTAGVVNGHGCCRKIVDINTYRVFCILYLKIHCQKYLLQLC